MEWLVTYMDTGTNQEGQDTWRSAEDRREWQREPNEITSTSIDNKIDNFDIDNKNAIIASSRFKLRDIDVVAQYNGENGDRISLESG